MVIFVDVDDTLVRSVGTKRIPIPSVIRVIRQLKAQGAILYCWSSGGSKYARASAEEFGLLDCFVGYLPKPEVMIDDQPFQDWRRLCHVYPLQADSLLGK
ncbi:hydrolase [Scytonema hofmannii FACHB-248]|uniref:Hydrolase n=1 Tax=Scytonema hofmannii FACHB-248 TaxID=1842502 RepID=A0ABR8GZP1_9CYAN|nr:MULTISPECIES: hydrolase [Nostocales]MBD2608545.1 hydrolase [Scytonema hofmannii FACHB-248]